MRFLLRCIICLGALYAAILRDAGYLAAPSRLAAATLAAPRSAGERLAASAGQQVAARLETFCRQDPAACLAGASSAAAPLSILAATPARKGRLPLGAGVP